MKREYQTCQKCGTELHGATQKRRGICGSCDRTEVEK